LEGIGTSTRGTKRKNDFSASKITKYRVKEPTDVTQPDHVSSESSDFESNSEESEFKGFSEASDNEIVEPVERSTTQVLPTGKYIPPAARSSHVASVKEDDQRLQKQIQGILNRYFQKFLSLNQVFLSQICPQSFPK
jgi:hypothetical protein